MSSFRRARALRAQLGLTNGARIKQQHVAARPVQVGYQAASHRVLTADEDDRDGLSEDHGHLSANQVGRQRGHATEVAARPACCNKADCYPTEVKCQNGQWYARRREDGIYISHSLEKGGTQSGQSRWT